MSGISSIPPIATPIPEPVTVSPPKTRTAPIYCPESPIDPPSGGNPPDPPSIPFNRCSPPLSAVLPPVPRRSYRLLSVESLHCNEIRQSLSGSGHRYPSGLSSSSASAPIGKSSPSPLSSPALNIDLLSQDSPKSNFLSKVPALNLNLLLHPESTKSETAVQTNSKHTPTGHTPIRETPGDISGRYCNGEPSLSVRFVTNRSSPASKSKVPSSPHFFMRHVKRVTTPTPLQHSSSSSGSSTLKPLSPRPFEGTFAEVHLITDMKRKFSEDTAAETIAAYLTSEENREENIKSVLNVLLPYHKMQKNKQIEQRWTLLLTAILLHLECVDLIYAFLQETKIEYLDFAAIITAGFLYKKTSANAIAHIISLYTQKDLKHENPDDTLFRSSRISTSLISCYGHHLLTDFLAQLEKTISKYWKKQVSPEFLCLNHQKIRENLLKSRKGFASLSIENQDQLCAEIMQRNKEPCKQFFFHFLNHFYEESLPEACKDLLERRRNQICHFIQEKTVISAGIASDLKIALSAEQIHQIADTGTTKLSLEQAKKKSEELVGADLFLRIINPHLLKMSMEPFKYSCLLRLSKMIQTISNQSPPELPKQEENAQQKQIKLNEEDLIFCEAYAAFEEIHQTYINTNFPYKQEDVVQKI